MANEQEKLEIKKKPQELSQQDLDKTAGGTVIYNDDCGCHK